VLGGHSAGEVVEPAPVLLAKLSDGAGTVAAASGAAGDTLLEVGVDVSAAVSLVVEAVIAAGVEVAETNGGAFSMYDPDGCTA
jgi:hypothetical protein